MKSSRRPSTIAGSFHLFRVKEISCKTPQRFLRSTVRSAPSPEDRRAARAQPVVAGDSVVLRCGYELGGETLYAVSGTGTPPSSTDTSPRPAPPRPSRRRESMSMEAWESKREAARFDESISSICSLPTEKQRPLICCSGKFPIFPFSWLALTE
ncbi:hypothetical protein CEXT_18371 [Caerostris extrusa]|uniref:Uncharacterized protein n=1 Tax=Caerostris extrusa TaxID=172846 RepID=A0AAV4Y2I4_CAEEX|nr:hypothetical protein CEXT_18371 [Caerostris extrusa]